MNKEQVLEALRAIGEFVERCGDAWHRKGYEFERRFAELCEAKGYACYRAPRGHYDFVVNGLRVQCKKLTPNERGIVFVQPGSGPAYPRNSFDVLVIESDEGIHIVPEEHIPSVASGLVRANNKITFLRKFTNAWWVFESAGPPPGFEVQLRLGLEPASGP